MGYFAAESVGDYAAELWGTIERNIQVAGHIQAIDSAPIKANASMDSLLLKQSAESLKIHLSKVIAENGQSSGEPSKENSVKPEQIISAPEYQLRRLEKHQDKLTSSPGALGANHKNARLVSNKTHYSPTDPDARISVKPGKARKSTIIAAWQWIQPKG